MNGRRHAMIREATARSHAALDAEVTRAGLFDSVAGYGEFLRGLHGFHSELDRSAGTRLRRDLTEWSIAPRLAWLASDLAALGLAPAGRPAAPVTTAPLPDTDAACAGTLYVLLGASLGARILVRRVSALPLDLEDGGMHYLSRLASDDQWPRFMAHLETLEPADESAMSRAANQMFDRIRDHVSRQTVA